MWDLKERCNQGVGDIPGKVERPVATHWKVLARMLLVPLHAFHVFSRILRTWRHELRRREKQRWYAAMDDRALRSAAADTHAGAVADHSNQMIENISAAFSVILEGAPESWCLLLCATDRLIDNTVRNIRRTHRMACAPSRAPVSHD